jgi:hypothetical protein
VGVAIHADYATNFFYVVRSRHHMNRTITSCKSVGDRDHEVLDMGSFGEYKLFRELSTSYMGNKH